MSNPTEDRKNVAKRNAQDHFTATAQRDALAREEQGKLRAKTGTLTGVKALTGFVPADDGHTLTFAFVYNGPNARESAASLWDRFGRALATYPYRPDLSAFAPAPATTTGG